jgi:SAM-dependent methyltransferase
MRRIKRKFLPYPTTIDEWTLEQGLRQVEMLRAVGCDVRGTSVLELGTGWKPVIPLIFRLAGCDRLILVDSQRLLDRNLMIGIIQNLAGYKDMIAARLGLPVERIEQRLTLSDARSLDAIFHGLGIEYRAPYDARDTRLPDGEVDVVISRAVLEHIPAPVIADIFRESNRILTNGGHMCHIVDNSDHWAHNDKSITLVNFLRFEEQFWKLCAINPLDYQNRLRHFEYLRIARETGFEIALDRSSADQEQVQNLKQMQICSRYRDTPLEELAIMTSYFVASKPATIRQ